MEELLGGGTNPCAGLEHSWQREPLGKEVWVQQLTGRWALKWLGKGCLTVSGGFCCVGQAPSWGFPRHTCTKEQPPLSLCQALDPQPATRQF